MSINSVSALSDNKPVFTGLFDTHCHLDLPELASHQSYHWQNAVHNGVKALLIPAVEQKAWQPLLALNSRHSNWHIALGIHPWWAAKHSLNDVALLDELLSNNKQHVCAVGEIGLDFALDESSFTIQSELFQVQLQLAKKHNKPVVLHHRKSQNALLKTLKNQHFSCGGILHAFSGSVEQAKAFVDLGFKLGIGGTITYARAAKTQKVVQTLPLTAFVLETDAPSMPLYGYQGQINTPAMLKNVFEAFCALRQEPQEDIAQQLWQNSEHVLYLS